MIGLLPQIPYERYAELDADTDPWVSVPTDDACKADRRYRRQCSTMHCWIVHRVYYRGMSDLRQWKRIAIEETLRRAVSAMRRVAPTARRREDWRDPEALRYSADPWVYFITESYVDVAYRRGR
jgi:hypothetical protein